MDWLSKTLDFIAKYFWAVFVVAAFVLFVPDDASKQIGVYSIREEHKGIWWIVLVLSGAIWSRSAFTYFDKKLSSWLKNREKAKQKIEQEIKRITTIQNRLDSLDNNEQLWIKYCLYNNTQTLSAQRGDKVAQSLAYKGILIEGSGHILDLPFHIPDDVWEHLNVNEHLFLPESDLQNPQFEDILKKFHEDRHAF